MNAEGTALAHEPIQQQRSGLRHAIVLGEKFLELVDDQQRARQRFLAAGALEARHVLHAEFAEEIATPAQFFIHAFEHAQAELAITLDRHHARVGKALRAVALELDAFLEVHEIELHLVGRVPEREVRDHHVEQRRFTGARLAGDEDVLLGALAERELLQLGGASATHGHPQLTGRFERPQFGVGRRDVGEGHFHAV